MRLCRLVNAVSPGIVKKYKVTHGALELAPHGLKLLHSERKVGEGVEGCDDHTEDVLGPQPRLDPRVRGKGHNQDGHTDASDENVQSLQVIPAEDLVALRR